METELAVLAELLSDRSWNSTYLAKIHLPMHEWNLASFGGIEEK